MPTITVELPTETAEAITRQARRLLLGRKAYVRALLAAVAAAVEPPSDGTDDAVVVSEPMNCESGP